MIKVLVVIIAASLTWNWWFDKRQANQIAEQQVLISALQKNKEMQNKVIMRLVNLNGGLR